MVRGSRAGVGSPRRASRIGGSASQAHGPAVVAIREGEESTDTEIAVAIDAGDEVMTPQQSDPTHPGVASAAGVGVQEFVPVTEGPEAGELDVADPWALAIGKNLCEVTGTGGSNNEIQEPEGLLGVPDAIGALIREESGEGWSRYPRKPGSFS